MAVRTSALPVIYAAGKINEAKHLIVKGNDQMKE